MGRRALTTWLLAIALLVGAIGSAPAQKGAGSSPLATTRQGLIGYWDFDEASGNRAAAFQPLSLTLTDNNTVGNATGKIGNAAQFVASSSEYLSLADNAAMSVADIDFTVAFWVNFSALSTTRRIIQKGSGTTNNLYAYNVRWTAISSRLRFDVSANGSFGTVDANNFGALSTSTWYFVVAWHDASANTINIQVNDGTADSAAWSAGSWDDSNSFLVGQTGASSEFLDASVDAVMFWKRVLTAAEKTYLYNSGNGRAPL